MTLIQDFIPAPTAIHASVWNAALPEVKDQKLRAALIKNPELSDALFGSILERHGLSEQGAVDFGNNEALVRIVMRSDFAALCLRIGAATQAELISQLATTRLNDIIDIGITRDTIRATLAHRHAALPTKSKDLPSRSDLEREGAQCLWDWIASLPDIAAALFALRFGAKDPKISATKLRKERCKICTAVLEQIAEERSVS